MKISNYNNAGDTIVALHTGRGGRFNNAGHVTFLGEKKISDFTGNLFTNFENQQQIYEAIDGRENLIKKYDECNDKEDFSFFKKLGLDAGELIYVSEVGERVGLTVKEAESGVGSIDIDGAYDTTTCLYVKDLSEGDIEIIIASNVFDRQYILNEYAKFIGFDDYEIELMQHFDDYENALLNSLPQINSDGNRCGYVYGVENYIAHESDENLNEECIELNGKFYTKI